MSISRPASPRTIGGAELTLDNAFDERDDQYNYSECTAGTCGPEKYIVTNRPRTISLRVGQKF